MLNIVKKHLKEVKSFYSENDIEVEEFRIKYNGKKGVLNKLFKSFRDVPEKEKKEFGKVLNELKDEINNKIINLQKKINQ